MCLWSQPMGNRRSRMGKLVYKEVSKKKEKSINIYGNGKQVRDVLFIGDLVKLYEISLKNLIE